MERFRIRGPVALKGQVRAGGAKNTALPLMCAALLAQGTSVLRRVPRLRDTRTLVRVLETLGARCRWEGEDLHIDASELSSREAPYELVKTMRASITVLGPLIGRYPSARVSLPGGCAWGPRPVDLHLKGLERLGARIDLDHGYIKASWPERGRLQGAEVSFAISSVGATENVLMAAVLARGRTVLRNAAREPDVQVLAHGLVSMGARIEGIGSGTLTVDGVPELRPYDLEVPPDRIEVGTFLAAAPATGGQITVVDCIPEEQRALLEIFREGGLDFEVGEDFIRVDGSRPLNPVEVVTAPYPGFPTDMQAQFMVLMSIARGTSMITETIFENRFIHVSELKRMGADIQVSGNTAIVRGASRLSAAPVMATDLRASASLILAGLVAEGATQVNRVYHLDRGYQSIEKKFAALGAAIQRTG